VKLAFKPEEAPKAAAIRSTAQFDLVLEVPQGQQEAQRKRIEKEKDLLIKNIASLERQLGNESFVAKAPPAVVASMRQKLAEYKAQLDRYE
jgi:valyl-tRNA synthetase